MSARPRRAQRWQHLVCVALFASCTSVQTVHLPSEAVHVGPGLHPIAGIQANAATWYLLYVPVAGEVSLDEVVNRMLITTAKAMGADKVTNVQFEMTPDDGIWALRKLFLWRSARASGIAVRVEMPPVDHRADDGPEPAQPTLR